jgi:hypothetical protein
MVMFVGKQAARRFAADDWRLDHDFVANSNGAYDSMLRNGCEDQAVGLEKRGWAGYRALLDRDAVHVTVSLISASSEGGCFSERRVKWDDMEETLHVTTRSGRGAYTRFRLDEQLVFDLRSRLALVNLWWAAHKLWMEGRLDESATSLQRMGAYNRRSFMLSNGMEIW